MLVYGYKPNGESCLFNLEDGATLPPGWFDDHTVIKDTFLRTAEAITEACGASIVNPVKIGPGAFRQGAPVAAVVSEAKAKAPRLPAAKRRPKKRLKLSPEERSRRRGHMLALHERRRQLLYPAEPGSGAP